ncbi:MAG: class I SAM-dependent methyltransferase [Actinomycetota bacterium]
MPDALFDDPRLAVLYDDLHPGRDDLAAYEALIAELGARSVLDVGCGTGSLAVRLAASGLDVVGVDPAAASLDVARGKEHADRVRWVHGDATSLPAIEVDLAVMTGNVAQVFVADDDWLATLAGVRRVLRPDGWFVFETRDPERRAWEDWTSDRSKRGHVLADGRTATVTHEVIGLSLPLVTFRTTIRVDGDEPLRSTSTLHFRSRERLAEMLEAAGFAVREIRDAPDRPGLELVHLTQPA